MDWKIVMIIIVIILVIAIVSYVLLKKDETKTTNNSNMVGIQNKPEEKQNNIGENCPCVPEGWCNTKDNKCYETCLDTITKKGKDIPYKDIYYCDYKDETPIKKEEKQQIASI